MTHETAAMKLLAHHLVQTTKERDDTVDRLAQTEARAKHLAEDIARLDSLIRSYNEAIKTLVAAMHSQIEEQA